MKNFASLMIQKQSNQKEAVALIDRNGLRKTTWGELYDACLKVASFASAKKLSGVVPVGMERSAEAVATLLGLNLAGVGVSPLPADVPKERAAFIEKETENVLWTAETYRAAMAANLPAFSATDAFNEPAVVVYTSGSTGQPKGVMLSNEGICKAIIRAAEAVFAFTKDDVALQSSSFSFVAHFFDLLAPLYAGVTVHLLPEEAKKDAVLMTDYINRHGITAMFATPKVLRLLGKMPSMRTVMTGGERLSDFAGDGYRLVNVYGLSETNGGAFSHEVTKPEKNTPIGKPFDDFRCWLLDENGNPADEGEICISGAIATGYYKRPELTAQFFTQNFFSNEPEHRVLLHTGDMARRLETGDYLFLNRRDLMIKINGQRVEPGEAEAVIKKLAGVKDAAVIGCTEADGRSYLCAYCEADADLDMDACRSALSVLLPSYMIPGYWVRLDRIPLNGNGKIDRKALPKPTEIASHLSYTAPVGETEKKLAEAFESVLSVKPVGATDDFFRLGGDSIRAMAAAKYAGMDHLRTGDILAGRTPRKIAEILQNKPAAAEPEIGAAPDFAPLTNSQMGIYLSCMRRPDSVHYNLPLHLTFERKTAFTAETVKSALDGVIRCHPALTSFLKPEGENILMCRSLLPAEGIVSVTEASAALTEEEEAAFVKPFDLFKGPLCRAEAILTPKEIHFYFDAHHIVADGTSVTVLLKEWKDALAGKPVAPERTDAFSVSALEQREMREEALAAAEKHFEALLSGAEIDSNLLFDKKPEPDSAMPSDMEEASLVLPGLSAFLSSESLTESSFLMGVFGYTLAKMTGQEESLFAVAESGRKSALTENTVSMFVRTLPMLYRLDETETASAFLQKGQNTFFESVKNDLISFGKLASDYGIGADVMFVYQADMLSEDQALRVCRIPVHTAIANFTLSVWKRGDSYLLHAEYRSDCYEKQTVRRFLKLYQTVAEAFADNAVLQSIPLISEDDLAALHALNETESAFDAEKTVVNLFSDCVLRYPEKTALVCRDKRYTYREVDGFSSRISAYLHRLGIRKGQTVSILVPRCEYMVIAALGVLKAGAVYQPLDPSYPSDRLSFMCKDADSKLLIADRELSALLPNYGAQVLYLDEIPSLTDESYQANPAPEDGFVLLYTSGTTGLPKGCRLLHRNVSSYVHAFHTLFDSNSESVFGAYASFGFDAHLSELFPPLTVGAALYIITEDIRLDLPALKAYFEENGITHTVMTTQIARQFVSEYPKVAHLRSILCGGERLGTVTPPATYRLTNGYGPTESTVMVTCFPVDAVYPDIPIGKALPNVKIYVVDRFGRRVPIGVPGELIASGLQVAEQYINRPEKTAEVFVKNTFEADVKPAYEPAYKTGDIVRYLSDGNLEIIGRRDAQVKIRGFRIELSEVETVLREFPSVKDAVAIAVDDPSDGKCIHAYIVAEEKVDIQALNAFIKERKPSYMVPAATMQIDAIPLTPNFKVDKRKLPPIVSASPERETAVSRQMTALEEKIAAILEGIVGHRRFGVETEFTDAGITSITSIRLAVQIYKQFGLHITSKHILDGGTILSLENAIVAMLFDDRQSESALREAAHLSSYPLTKSQLGVYTDCLGRGMDTYRIPLLLELDGAVSTEKLKAAVKTAVGAHPSMLVTVYPDADGTPRLHPRETLPFEVEEETVERLCGLATSFAFEDKPLFRFRILHSGEKRYFFLEIHHIIADGESIEILLRDIAAAYAGQKIEKETFTFFDLEQEEEKASEGQEFETAEAYYDAVFRGVSADYLPCPDRFEERRFAEYATVLPINGETVKAFLAQAKVSENVFFSSIFAVTLARMTSHDDALFTTVHNGRGDPRTENLVGMTVKTLPIYIGISPEETVPQFLHGFSDRLTKLKKYDNYSFADASRKYGISPDPMFIYQGRIMQENPLGRAVKTDAAEVSKTALTVEIAERDRGFALHAEYNGGQYSEAFIRGFADAFSVCAEAFLSCERLGDISICSPAARTEFTAFNDTKVEVEKQPAYRLFEKSVARHPDKTAVVAGNDSLTYRELDNAANALSVTLSSLGMARGSAVALLFDRTADIYIAEIGVLKASDVFLCLSPEYPDERISFILNDADVKAIVTTRAVAQKRSALLSRLDLPILYTDGIDRQTTVPGLGLDVDFEARAYLIYTSGSTGQPKGVTVLQKGLVTIADANPKNKDTTAFANDESVSTAVCAFTFDASVMEGFVALANGSTVCIADETQIHNPDAFCDYCLKQKVTSLFGTPSFLLNLSDCEKFPQVAKGLKTVLAGGEEFTQVLLHRLLEQNPDLYIINGYGPSEATVTCSSIRLRANERITIGKPLANTALYCLDAQNHILPMGALGELTIVGDGVGGGYLNRDDLTKKAFIRVEGQSAFKTGDLAVITHAGTVEFHGRIDNQVKIRGLRVELGEIEAVMSTVAGIKNAVVVVKGTGENKYLAGYFTANRQLESEEILTEISKKLASYMIPRRLMQLPAMPMTANGKINRKALPDIPVQKEKRGKPTEMTETERVICALYADILQSQDVLPDDNFFDLGGNSLLASRAVMMLKSRGYNLEYQTIFDCQTPRELGAFLNQNAAENEETSLKSDENDTTESIFAEVLKYNTLPYAKDTERTPLGDVVLTGAVGFLGIHILRELLTTESGHIYCLVRRGSFPTPESRLNAISFYYFGSCLTQEGKGRITVLDADITSENLLLVCKNIPFDTVINCAASVKHFASDRSIEFVNVHGVENLISLVKAKNAKLIQISTTSVPGVHTEKTLQEHAVLHENQLFKADQMNNQYILSKYQAEERMLRAIRDGMRGKIIRVGNLMGRYSDGEFQINMGSNAFLKALRGFGVIGKFPVGHSTEPMEFSPIDCTAKAVVALAGTNDKFTLFHANTRYVFDEMLLMKACNRAGIRIVPTEDDAYYEEFNRLLGDPKINPYLSALVTNDRPGIHAIEVDNRFTANVLYRIGFSWPFMDDGYLDRIIKSLSDIGFFDRND